MAEFLFEIGTEEIPARFLRKAEQDLKSGIEKVLKEAQLSFDPLEVYGAPRQLTVFSFNVAEGQEDRVETITGPPVRIAYDGDGNPSKALQGFLRKNPELKLEDLVHVQEKKGEVVAGKVEIKGRPTTEILAEAIPSILGSMHFPKNMRWGNCPTRFVRPVRSLLAIFGGNVIPFSFANMETSNQSFGHRLTGKTFDVDTIASYIEQKDRYGIMVSREQRREMIRKQIEGRLAEIQGNLVEDPDLFEELCDLVERPYVVLGAFDKMFLDIPKEVLVTSMRDHQKSFTVQDEDGKLMPYFLSIANVVGDEKGLIRKGNEWVLNARLWDAKFFWEADLKKDLDQLRLKLKDLVFQNDIGSYFEKTERIAKITAAFADQLNLDDASRAHLHVASSHCKTDLVSELVFEFPELQGITGGLLMARQGKDQALADAIYDSYLPNSMDDDIPRTSLGGLVSVADKIDTLVGCFAIGLIPTGTKDPYALRRATQGIVRVLIERELSLSLDGVLRASIAAYEGVLEVPEGLHQQLREFFIDRMRYYLKREGFDHQLTDAVLARDTDRVDQTLKRAQAIELQRADEGFRTIALNLKRINNVVADEEDNLPEFDPALLVEDAEKALWSAFSKVKPEIEGAADQRDYNKSMTLMGSLSAEVEAYFGSDGVFINTDDPKIRLNRKAMLDTMRQTLGLVADISCLG